LCFFPSCAKLVWLQTTIREGREHAGYQIYQRQGIGKALMALAFDASPTSLFFGAQPEAEGFYEKLGYEKSLQSFGKKKTRRQ